MIIDILTDLIPEFILTTAFLLYVLLVLLHAMQYVEDPKERTAWVLWFVFGHAITATIYLLTKYRYFRKIGKGKLLKCKNVTFKQMGTLSEPEKKEMET